MPLPKFMRPDSDIEEDVPPSNFSTPKPERKPRAAKSYKDLISALVSGVNQVVAASPFRDDRLTQEEGELLVESADKFAQTNKRFRTFVEKSGTVGSTAAFIGVCVSIMIPRLQRHGVLPNGDTTTVPNYDDAEQYNVTSDVFQQTDFTVSGPTV
jgi:hypothetical protein